MKEAAMHAAPAVRRRGAPSGAAGLLAALLVLLLGPADGLEAQGIDWIPQAGVFVPLNDLARVDGEGGQVTLGRRESAVALGLGIEVGARGPVSLRGSLLFGPSADLPVEGTACTGCEVRSSLLVAGAALLLRPTPSLAVIRPYLLGGAAVKRYGLDDGDLRSSGFRAVLQDPSRTALHLGAGLELGLGPADVIVELSDYVSRFEPLHGDGGLQNDVFLMVGLRL